MAGKGVRFGRVRLTDALHAVTWGKQINTLLFGRGDFEYALSRDHSFREILDVKLQAAARFGEVNYSFKTYLDTVEAR